MTHSHSNNSFFKSELGLRILSALVLLVITIGLCWLGGWSFHLCAIGLSIVLFYEWQGLVRVTPFDSAEAILTTGFAAILLASFFGGLFYIIPAFLILGFVLEMVSKGQEKYDVRWIGLGALYCAIPALTFPLIREAEGGNGFFLLMFVFFVVWATDVAAYFSGRAFGGPKLFAALSPKKTWSGAMGGLLAAIFIGLLASAISGYSFIILCLVAAVLSVLSQIGDLFESWVKRLFAKKDSSQLIPGHGGFLDRVDGLVVAVLPVAFFVI